MRLQEISALAGLKVRTNQGHPICSPDFAFVITYAIPSKSWCPVYVELPVKLKWTITLKFAYIFIWFLEFLFQKVYKALQMTAVMIDNSSSFHVLPCLGSWLISSTIRKKNCSWCPQGHDEKHGWDGLFAPFFGLILLHTLCTRIRQCPSHSALAEFPRPACRQNIFST
jgi:hypothetical protein